MNPAANPNALSGPTTSLDAYVPSIDFGNVATLAQHTDGALFLWVGGAAVGLGFTIRMMVSLWNQKKTRNFDIATPIAHLMFWLTVGASYKLISVVVINTVSALGLMHSDSAINVTEIFARRYAGFLAHQQQHSASGLPAMLTATGWKVASMELIVHVCWVLVTCLIFGIKAMQGLLLQIIVTIGPILLGFASIGTFFHVLAVSWFWSLFEVSMWSVTMGVFLSFLNGFAARLPADYSWVMQLIVSVFTVMGIAGTMAITAMLVRGNSAGAVGRDMGQAAYAVARLSAAVSKMSSSNSGSALGKQQDRVKAAGKVGLAAGQAMGRKAVGLVSRASPGVSSSSATNSSGGSGLAPGADSSNVVASARRKQQAKHFAIKAGKSKGRK